MPANDAPPRILLVLPTYLPETFGGAEQQSRKLASALVQKGAAVSILTPAVDRKTPRREQDGAVHIRRFWQRHLPNLGGRYMASFLLWTAKSAFHVWTRRRDIDVVHIIHGRLHAVGPLIGAALARKPALVKIGRGGDHFDIQVVRNKTLIGLPCAFLIKRLATGFVANSQEIADDFDAHDVARDIVHRIPNGVVMPPAHEPENAPGAICFVYLGRLDVEKALDRMIEGFAQLPENAAAKLILVGDGPCGEELMALAMCLGIAHRLEFPGRVDDVAPYLESADFYISTSLSEGMSNALLEAMSHAVPPLVSRVSGVADMVSDGTSGLLFDAGDQTAYVAKLRNAIEMTPATRRQLGLAAAETVRTRFGIDSVAERHLALYAGLMRNTFK
jgi:glycosyltransferase involved in cell wall biosynthesis